MPHYSIKTVRSTIDIYTQAIAPAKREAQASVLSLLYLIRGTRCRVGLYQLELAKPDRSDSYDASSGNPT
jgi:hypothetical protein